MALLKERRRGRASDSRATQPRALASSARACSTCMRLDHPALVALGAAGRRRRPGGGRPRAPPRSGRTGGWRSRSGSGWITDLPSKPKARPSAHSAARPCIGLEPVVDAVERGDAGGAGGEHDPLQRVGERRARPLAGGRPRSAARSLVPAIRPARRRRDRRRVDHRARRLDHRQHRLADQPAGVVHLLGALRLGEDDEIGRAAGARRRRPRHNARSPVGLTRIAHRAAAEALARRRHRRLARRLLVLRASPHPRGRGRPCRRRASAPSRSRAGWRPAGRAGERQRRRSVRSMLPILLGSGPLCLHDNRGKRRGVPAWTWSFWSSCVLVVLWLFASVKIVRQGYQYTIEYFGRFTTTSRARA